ncbi:MAG TPA: L,D-transpeptidase family protein, partial [Thermoleophilia bacterium]|nr:L,D-transpeptidase family protein [Thermoleophilia bacterium]
HLADYRQAYEFAASTGYNAPPNQRVFGRGSAIFIHVDHAGYSAGCVTLARRDMIALLRTLRGGTRLACAIGVTHAGQPTSITAY